MASASTSHHILDGDVLSDEDHESVVNDAVTHMIPVFVTYLSGLFSWLLFSHVTFFCLLSRVDFLTR